VAPLAALLLLRGRRAAGAAAVLRRCVHPARRRPLLRLAPATAM
jgi:hypothetical protein